MESVKDIRFLGFYLYQVQSSINQLWYVYLQPRTELLDEQGGVIQKTNPEDRRWLISSGLKEPWSCVEMVNQFGMLGQILQERVILGELKVAHKSPEEIIQKGFSKETVEVINTVCMK